MQPLYRVLLLLALATLTLTQTTRAQVVRVTNGQSLSALIASATAGTTFIVEPGFYGDLTISKRVVIIGPGYFLGSNQQATTGSATFGTINFKAGSENSILMSCVVNGINIGASQVTVSKCLTENIRIGYDGNSSQITANITVKQCFIQSQMFLGNGGMLLTGCLIKNNIVRYGIYVYNTFQGDVSNNTIFHYSTSLTGYGIEFNSLSSTAYVVAKNNIGNSLYLYTSYPQNINAIYNVLYSNQTGLPTSNKVNQAPSTLFVGNNATSIEGQYMLSANSPAKGAGEGGVDCGAFGGDEPYVIGGVPSGPVITELTVPQVTSGSTLNVRVRAKVQN